MNIDSLIKKKKRRYRRSNRKEVSLILLIGQRGSIKIYKRDVRLAGR